jgi:hypothetical protein
MKFTKPVFSKVILATYGHQTVMQDWLMRAPTGLPQKADKSTSVRVVKLSLGPCVHGVQVLPLRSLLLDPEANTMPPCRTQSEFLRNVRERNFAHQSYDIVSAP